MEQSALSSGQLLLPLGIDAGKKKTRVINKRHLVF